MKRSRSGQAHEFPTFNGLRDFHLSHLAVYRADVETSPIFQVVSCWPGAAIYRRFHPVRGPRFKASGWMPDDFFFSIGSDNPIIFPPHESGQIIATSGKSRLVKYYNLARWMD